MQAVFIPYGKRSEVELLLTDMEAQKHILTYYKGKKKVGVWIQGQVRLLPMGAMEYVCPKEDIDAVMTTLVFKAKDSLKVYNAGNLKLAMLRKLYKCKKIPKFDMSKKYLWIKEHVMIIPIGIREDGEMTDPSGDYKGWTHEAI